MPNSCACLRQTPRRIGLGVGIVECSMNSSTLKPDSKPAEGAGSASASPVGQLVFFGEDWGRHPSTAQYLAGQLVDEFRVTWINSIGLREPSLSGSDLKRVFGKLSRAVSPSTAPASATTAATASASASARRAQPHHLVSPWVLPWHRFALAQAFNREMFKRQIARQPQLTAQPYSVITANPASYYLLDTLAPETSLYYCCLLYTSPSPRDRG